MAAHPDGVGIYPQTFTQWFGGHVRARACRPSAFTTCATPAPQRRIQVARVPVKVVSQRLGHANVTVTTATYAHVLPGDDEAAADATAALILGPDR